MMDAELLAGWAVALTLVACIALAAPRTGQASARRALALLLVYLAFLAAAAAWLPLSTAAWASAIAAAAVVAATQPLIALGVIERAELGWTAPRADSLRPAVAVIGVAVVVHALIIGARGTVPVPLTATIVAAALAAAVLEELVFRGTLLALLDRALPPRWSVAGARIGWGGVALTAAFVMLHGLRPGLLLGVLPAALLYLWLRARTGSLLPPIIAHLAWNSSVLWAYS